jgi:hypothetical protein
MSEIVTLLTKSAELEKQAYFNYIKSFSSAGISALVKGGMQFDTAAGYIKAAAMKDATISQMGEKVQVLEKTAEYVLNLETKLEGLEKIAAEYKQEEKVMESEPLTKLAGLGFSRDEVEQLSSLPEDLIQKMASVGSQPWELGTGAGMKREQTDPLLEFILS